MRKLIIGFVLFFVLAIGALAVVPSLVPSSVYKEKIQMQLSKELARDVQIDGDVKLSVFPSIRAKTDKVTILNPEGFSDDVFASMDGLDAKIKLFPLFKKQVVIKSFTLRKPEINLEVNESGTANWVFGEPDTKKDVTDDGPFKRDGRYADIDPAIGLFSIEEGAITYADRVKGKSYDLSDVNVSFSLPSLSKRVKIDGDLKFDNRPIDIRLMLDSPRDFLNGKESALELDIKTDFADISSKGKFLTGPEVGFEIDLDGEVNDFAALREYMPKDMPYTGLADSAKIGGTYRYDGQSFSASGADIAVKGDVFDATYSGDVAFKDALSLTGQVSADVRDVPELAKLLSQDVAGVELAKTAQFTANMKALGSGFSAENIKAKIIGDGLNAEFDGVAAFDQSVSVSGAFKANAASVPAIVKALKLEIPQTAALGNADVTGQLSMKGDVVDVVVKTAKTEGGKLSANYTGTVSKMGEVIKAAGKFDVDIPDASELALAASMDMPQARAAGRVTANGNIDYSGQAVKLSEVSAVTDGGIFQGKYDGDITLGEIVAFAGRFDSQISSMTDFAQTTEMDIPYASSIGAIEASGDVSGAGKDIALSNINALMRDGQLNGQFTGKAAMVGGLDLDGQLAADIPSIRALAATAGTELPPSTKTGSIYETLAINGRVTGTPTAISFKQAEVAVDDLKGKGDFKVDLTQQKPFVTGVLDMEGLDLRPYMASYAAQNPTGEIQPWSEQPLNLSIMNAFDGDFKFNTPNIITDRMNMGEAKVDAKLRNGTLKADLPRINMYGGLGSLNASLDASKSVPAIALDVNLDDLNSNKFLGAVAGFTKATGEGKTALSIRGAGLSQAAIMKSLQGQGDFKLLNGELVGVDLSQLLTGLDTAFASKALPSGIGNDYATKFKDVIGLFKIENGIAKIDKFALDGFGAAAIGSGEIDLGNQSIDFSLQPRLTSTGASDLASFGIPIRLKGNFGDVAASLDTQLLGKIAAARAKAKLKDELTNQVGGTAGDILGGILGGSNSQTDQSQSGQPKPEDIASDLLGNILGSKKKEAQPDTQDAQAAEPEKEETKKKEPSIEGAILDIFGSKKKKD